MADISAFPTITNVVKSERGPMMTFTGAGSIDIKPGMVVCYDSTGVSWTAQAALAASNDGPIGVAVTSSDVSESEKFTVALAGNVVKVANADDSTAIDARDWLVTNDNAVGGTVSAADLTATGGATASLVTNVIGIALEDIAGGGTGYMLVMPITITRANSS